MVANEEVCEERQDLTSLEDDVGDPACGRSVRLDRNRSGRGCHIARHFAHVACESNTNVLWHVRFYVHVLNTTCE